MRPCERSRSRFSRAKRQQCRCIPHRRRALARRPQAAEEGPGEAGKHLHALRKSSSSLGWWMNSTASGPAIVTCHADDRWDGVGARGSRVLGWCERAPLVSLCCAVLGRLDAQVSVFMKAAAADQAGTGGGLAVECTACSGRGARVRGESAPQVELNCADSRSS